LGLIPFLRLSAISFEVVDLLQIADMVLVFSIALGTVCNNNLATTQSAIRKRAIWPAFLWLWLKISIS